MVGTKASSKPQPVSPSTFSTFQAPAGGRGLVVSNCFRYGSSSLVSMPRDKRSRAIGPPCDTRPTGPISLLSIAARSKMESIRSRTCASGSSRLRHSAQSFLRWQGYPRQRPRSSLSLHCAQMDCNTTSPRFPISGIFPALALPFLPAGECWARNDIIRDVSPIPVGTCMSYEKDLHGSNPLFFAYSQ